MSELGLIQLFQFSDSVLPVGGFAFSNGLESAVQTGIVHNADTLKAFTRDALYQAATGDARAIVATCQALQTEDYSSLVIENDRALYHQRLNEEGRLMLVRMGKKLAEMSFAVTEKPLIGWWLEKIKSGEAIGTYPITQSIVMSSLGAAPREVLVAHFYGVAMTILSAALRLMRITHIEIQKILFQLNQEILSFCEEAEKGGVEQMASYAPVKEILASLHVKAFTRLFSN
ncbi:urease accessory protein UreF [Acetobacteraceae bacterium]|nr:urease accessory protein UreF [Acetobacteraceae bacterium]